MYTIPRRFRGFHPHFATLTTRTAQRAVVCWRQQRQQQQLRCCASSSSSSSTPSASSSPTTNRNAPPGSVAVVGGGLAGLAVVYELLERSSSSLLLSSSATPTTQAAASLERITVYDVTESPGLGGASAVAGGLVHPLSPRGKLVYQGMEGLAATDRLIDAAIRHASFSSSQEEPIVLCDSIWRVAQTAEHERQLQATAQLLPDICTWLGPQQVAAAAQASLRSSGSNASSSSTTIRGVLKLSGPCRVIHVPSYLQGLWRACQHLAELNSISLEWNGCYTTSHQEWSPKDYDAVLWSAGAGLFQQNLIASSSLNLPFPLQLVRGQSLEFAVSSSSDDSTAQSWSSQALLCGKYVSPLPPRRSTDNNNIIRRVMVGATHEFTPHPMSSENVWNELKRSTEFMCPQLWNKDDNDHDDKDAVSLERTTIGYRVQSQRGANGRLPLLGKLPNGDWIYTGLSSRGILYHALFAKVLVDAIWNQDESLITKSYPELGWWKKTSSATT